MKNDCFVRHNNSCWLDDSSLEPREKEITCAGARRVRGFGVVFTRGAELEVRRDDDK